MKWQMRQILELHLFYSLKGVEAYHKKDVEIDKHPKPLFRKRGLFQFLQSALVTKKEATLSLLSPKSTGVDTGKGFEKK